MGITKIEWADFTLNLWTGCAKVSPACTNCYAESWAKRSGIVKWGEHEKRRRTSHQIWRQAYKWNSFAPIRYRVFVNSLSDFFEDKEELKEWRAEAFEVFKTCRNIDFLLLTKRADNIAPSLPADWGVGYPNVWLGVTVENQKYADERIPLLLQTPAAIRFLSCEPLLGEVDLLDTFPALGCSQDEASLSDIHWVIAGGESGHNARPSHPDWFRQIRDDCNTAGVAYFHKQNGEFAPAAMMTSTLMPNVLFSQRFNFEDGQAMYRVGKKYAGRLLDGKEFSQMPEVK